jgi:hypothetical protein
VGVVTWLWWLGFLVERYINAYFGRLNHLEERLNLLLRPSLGLDWNFLVARMK